MGIKIKGKAGGVFEVEIQPLSSFISIKKDISEHLAGNKAFFSGVDAKIVFSGKTLTKAQKKDLRRLLQMDYDISNVSFDEELMVKEDITDQEGRGCAGICIGSC